MASITAAKLIILKDRTSLAEDGPSLLARAKAGDQQAFFAFYHAHAGRIYSLSLRVTRDVKAAENLTRDIFFESFTCLDEVTDDAELAARLYRCAARKSLANGLKHRYPQGFGHRLAPHQHLSFVRQGDVAIHPE